MYILDSIMDIWLIELIDLFRLPKIMSLVRLQGIIQAVDQDMVVDLVVDRLLVAVEAELEAVKI
jgi:hypothetical protein